MPKTDKSKLDGIQASAVALSTVKADSDIADAITKKHANTNDPLADEKAALAGTSGTPSVSNKYVTNADSRNSDARTPSAHKTSHQSGGSDAVKLDDLSAPDDNTDLNASTSKHGLCPKAPNNVLQFLRGDGAFAALPLFACKAYRSSDLSIANASYTVVDLNAEEFDTDTMHDLVTNPSRLTVKTAGKYLIVANVWFAANATGIRIARIDVNGLGYSIASTNAVGSSYYTQFIVMHLHQCAVNDYIQLNVYQNSGGSLNLLTNSFLAAFRLGA